jgi:VWFA-related protein
VIARRIAWFSLTVAFAAAGGRGFLRAGQAPPRQPATVFRSNLELVLVNVVVRDKSGALVRGLTKDDFVLTEDNRPQTISTFDFEAMDAPAPAATAGAPPPILAPPAIDAGPGSRPAAAPVKADLHDRRLIVLFFDLTSMQEEEAGRAVRSARDYVQKRLTPSDLVGVVTLSASLDVVQDFTGEPARLAEALDRIDGASGRGFEEGATGTTEETADTGAAFTADDTEFNVFNIDRRLEALRNLTDSLSGIEQKKSVIYFSAGMNQTGLDNRVQLTTVIDHAVRANVSIYAADMRGLQAIVPGGDAGTASVRGQGAFSGRSMAGQFDRAAASQDTLATLAEDTGGRAFLDTNDFGLVYDRVLADTSAYYVLGYTSSNTARDGRFRRIRVRARSADLRLEYRAGYYAPRDFAHSSRDDREQQLEDQLLSDISSTDLGLYVAGDYFRQSDRRFLVPISLVVPGSEVPFTRASEKDRATLDVLGVVRDAQQRPVGRIRDTIKLNVEGTRDVRRKNVQYQTLFELPPGTYRFKAVVRENQDGTMGTFETDLVVPDLRTSPVKVSSIVLGTQIQPAARTSAKSPLVRDGTELVPNVAHVVSTSQHLYFYYEVYDASRASNPTTGGGAAGMRVLTNVAFYRGGVRVYETPLVEATDFTAADRRASVFRFDVPAASLQPGFYVCQVNVIDDVAGTFAFPRLALYVRR